MTRRLGILGPVLLAGLVASSCSLPSDDTVKRNTQAIEASTATLQQSQAAMQASRQSVEANTAKMAEVSADLEAVQQQADKALAVATGGDLDAVVTELRYSLVLAFMAFGFLVTTVGNDARVKCAELVLKHRTAAAGTPEASAIEQSADDFQNTYRWSLRLCGVVVLFLAVQLALGNGGGAYWLYLGAVAFTGLVLWNFYRVESRELIGISGGRLGLCRPLTTVIAGSRTASWK